MVLHKYETEFAVVAMHGNVILHITEAGFMFFFPVVKAQFHGCFDGFGNFGPKKSISCVFMFPPLEKHGA